MRTMLLYPTSEIPNDAPIEQIRLPLERTTHPRRRRAKTVGDVRKAANETLLRLRLNRGIVNYIRSTLG